jgi:hypothetical protein
MKMEADCHAIAVKSFALMAVKIPLARSRAPERLPEKGFALFEAKPSLQSPGSIEEHRVSRLRRDKGHRGPFLWFVSLGKQRNEQKDEAHSASC